MLTLVGVSVLLNIITLIDDSFQLELNDKCRSSLSKSSGVCVEPLNCAYFKENRKQLDICAFNKLLPIICCPDDGVKRKSVISNGFDSLARQVV